MISDNANLIVALSNIVGIPCVLYCKNPMIISIMIMSSVLMHLSDQKHGLPGIYPFNKFTKLFLWLDRLMAYLLTLQILYMMYYKWAKIPTYLIFYGIFGILLQFISEVALPMYKLNNHKVLFVISHCLWHFVAYTYYYKIVQI